MGRIPHKQVSLALWWGSSLVIFPISLMATNLFQFLSLLTVSFAIYIFLENYTFCRGFYSSLYILESNGYLGFFELPK